MAARATRRRRIDRRVLPLEGSIDPVTLALQLDERLLQTLSALDVANESRLAAEATVDELRAQNALLADRVRTALRDIDQLRHAALCNLERGAEESSWCSRLRLLAEGDTHELSAIHLARPLARDDDTTGSMTVTQNPELRRLRREERKQRTKAVIAQLTSELQAERARSSHERHEASHRIMLLEEALEAQAMQVCELQQRLFDHHRADAERQGIKPVTTEALHRWSPEDAGAAVEEHELTALLERVEFQSSNARGSARPDSPASEPFAAPESPRSEPSPTPSPSRSRQQEVHPSLAARNRTDGRASPTSNIERLEQLLADSRAETAAVREQHDAHKREFRSVAEQARQEIEERQHQLADLRSRHDALITVYREAERLASESSEDADRCRARLQHYELSRSTPMPPEIVDDAPQSDGASVQDENDETW